MTQGRIIPGTPGIKLLITHCNDYSFDEKKLAIAISLFVDEYSDSFKTEKFKTWEKLRNLNIELSAVPRTVKSAFSVKGKPVFDAPVSGLALNKNHIWVEIKTTQIWSSALAHELVHIIIWRSNGVHGDPDHEGKEYSGWSIDHTRFIERFNKKLLELEI